MDLYQTGIWKNRSSSKLNFRVWTNNQLSIHPVSGRFISTDAKASTTAHQWSLHRGANTEEDMGGKKEERRRSSRRYPCISGKISKAALTALDGLSRWAACRIEMTRELVNHGHHQRPFARSLQPIEGRHNDYVWCHSFSQAISCSSSYSLFVSIFACLSLSLYISLRSLLVRRSIVGENSRTYENDVRYTKHELLEIILWTDKQFLLLLRLFLLFFFSRCLFNSCILLVP